MCVGECEMLNELHGARQSPRHVLATRQHQQRGRGTTALEIGKQRIEQIVRQPIQQSVDHQQFRTTRHGASDHQTDLLRTRERRTVARQRGLQATGQRGHVVVEDRRVQCVTNLDRKSVV